jgi:hypothetical protein
MTAPSALTQRIHSYSDLKRGRFVGMNYYECFANDSTWYALGIKRQCKFCYQVDLGSLTSLPTASMVMVRPLFIISCNKSLIFLPIVALTTIWVSCRTYHVLCGDSCLHLNIQVYDYIICIPDSASGYFVWATDYLRSHLAQVAYIVESQWGLATLPYLACSHLPFGLLLLLMLGECQLCISVDSSLMVCFSEVVQPNASSTVWTSGANVWILLISQSLIHSYASLILPCVHVGLVTLSLDTYLLWPIRYRDAGDVFCRV